MIILIITLLVIVVGIGLKIYDKIKRDWTGDWKFFGNLILILGICALMIEFLMIILKPIDFTKFNVEYEIVKNIETDSKDVRDSNYLMKIIEINEQIEMSKKFVDNPFIGIFVNEQIAELELLHK